ncbi:MAG: hypothetical protein HY851_10930 [candidate division Zixibacteria bacterium]|nr:hypothetical protein [candidate division Zixibacteria bacterium]
MKQHRTHTFIMLAAVAAIGSFSMVWGRPAMTGTPRDGEADPPRMIPSPATIDQVIHDYGQLATTVDNWGYIGGFDWQGKPSGEWPKGSGHHYLAEIKYWMGAIVGIDTLVADTYEDFQGIPNIVSGTSSTKILLSTDTSRYYGYDPLDTLGSGLSDPALGWRVWNSDSGDWVYNKIYNPRDSQFYAGGPTSLQESHYRFNDAALGSSLLGLEMTQTVLQWNYCYNEDFLYVILEIKNTSATDYTNFAFGLYADIDVGANEYVGQNGQDYDLVGSDSLENLAWIYDSKGYDPGWKSKTGMMGTKFIETPSGIGMTAFRTGDWALVPADDPGKYQMITTNQFDGSNPPGDQYYVQCTRGINLLAGTTVRVVFALIAGEDEADFRANAAMAQTLYNSHYIGPQPPTTPRLDAQAGNGKVYLRWTDTSEVGLDPLTGINDFRGYKLYRSSNLGKSWGEIDFKNRNTCIDIAYQPLVDFPAGAIGDPMPHNFIDTALSNGVEYWYCLSAYDAGQPGLIDVLQSGFSSPGSAPNVVSVTPRTDPAGYYPSAVTVQHDAILAQIPSDGSVTPTVFDRNLVTSSRYKVVFTDTPDQTFWHLVNDSSGDTVLKNQTMENADPALYPIGDGLRIIVNNGDRSPRGYGQTGFAVATDTTLVITAFLGPIIPAVTGDPNDHFGDAKIRATYEIRYTGDSSLATSVWEGFDLIPYPRAWVPYEVWNTTTGQRVSFSITRTTGVWVPGNTLIIVDYPYDTLADLTAVAFPQLYSWGFRFSATLTPAAGDVFTIEGAPVNGPNDEFVFSPDGVSATQASFDLRKIHALPDPYFGRYSAQVENLNGESVIQFVNLPDKCTIRIYTLAGDLVRTLSHEGFTGTEDWNILSSDQRQVSSGVYLYHVESPYGERMGRLAIIK